jgi:hypothetical protein
MLIENAPGKCERHREITRLRVCAQTPFTWTFMTCLQDKGSVGDTMTNEKAGGNCPFGLIALISCVSMAFMASCIGLRKYAATAGRRIRIT